MPTLTFGAVTSQFGIEYGNFSSAVAELNRVASERASLLLVCHDTDSIIVEHNRKRQEVIRRLLAQSGLISALKKTSLSVHKKMCILKNFLFPTQTLP